MAGITLLQAQTQLDLYIAAEAKVLQNQSYEIDGRKLTRADLKEIQGGIDTWDARVKKLARSAAGSRRARTILM